MLTVTYHDIVEEIKRKGFSFIEKINHIRLPCPAHGGDGYSLVISRREDGGVLCKCHSQNCSFHSIIYAITGIDLSQKQAHSYTFRPLQKSDSPSFSPLLHTDKPTGDFQFPPSLSLPHFPPVAPIPADSPRASTPKIFNVNPMDILAIYSYTDMQGNILYQKLRMRTHNGDGSRRVYKVKNRHGYGVKEIPVPKFRFRHQVDGVWYDGKGDAPPVLYLAHLLPFAETVYLCEGEKDADTLNNALKDAGLFGLSLATTSYEGATGLSSPIAKWRPQYTSQLMGKTIVIFPDMDASGQGEHHAHLVAEQLVPCCPRVSVVSLPNATKIDGYDISDYLHLHPLAELLQLVDQVRPKTLSVIELPLGSYLSDYLTSFDQLPQFCILDAPTGIGKTTAAIRLIREHGCGIFVASSVLALLQLQKEYPDFGVYYQDEKRLQSMMLTTPESLPFLVHKLIGENLDSSTMPLIIDEWHNLATAGYRTGTQRMLEQIKNTPWLCIIGMSGTPLPIWTEETDRFETVRVQTPLRTQFATFVHWQLYDEQDNPLDCSRTDTIVQLTMRHLDRGERVMIHLDNKGAVLDALIAKLLVRGVPEDKIGTLNSDNKYERVGSQLIAEETIPHQCEVLIVTSIFVESANLKTTFGAVIIMADVHPPYAQQLVNRKRGEAIPHCYILNSGTHNGWEFNREAIHNHILAHAKLLCEALNASAEQNIPLTPAEMQIFGSHWHEKLAYLSQGVWTINELAVTQAVYEIECRYCLKNPRCWKNLARQYGWSFSADETLAMPRHSETRQQEKEICQDRSQKRAEAWSQQCGNLAILENANEAKEELKDTEGMPRRAIERAIELDSYLQQRETAEDSAEPWLDAIALLLSEQKDSARRHNKLLRILLVDQAREEGHLLLQLIEKTFLGQELTRDERHALLLDLYQSIPQFAPFTRNVLLRHWSKDEAPLLTPKDCDELLSCIFQVRKLHSRNQSRKWRFEAIYDIDALIEKHKGDVFSLRQEKLDLFNSAMPQETGTLNAELNSDMSETPPNFLYTEEIVMFSGVKAELDGDLAETPLNFDSYLEKERFSGVSEENQCAQWALVGDDEAKIEVKKLLITIK